MSKIINRYSTLLRNLASNINCKIIIAYSNDTRSWTLFSKNTSITYNNKDCQWNNKNIVSFESQIVNKRKTLFILFFLPIISFLLSCFLILPSNRFSIKFTITSVTIDLYNIIMENIEWLQVPELNIEADGKTIIKMCKNNNPDNEPQSSLLNVCLQTPPNPPSQRTRENPSVNCFCVTNRDEAFNSSMREFCLNFPIVMINGLVPVLDLNLSLFSTKTLVETNPRDIIEVRIQMPQTSEENWNRDRSEMVWHYYSHRIHKTIFEYAIYQTKKLQESIEKEKEDAQNKEMISSYFLDLEKFSQKTITKDTNKYKNEILFGTNVDLSNKKKWKQQLEELEKLPPLFQVESNENMLNHVGHDILGVNTVQLYMKIPGCRTPGHQENNNFCSININIGPGDCEWFAVPYEYWGAVYSLCKRNGVKYLSSWWPSNLDELRKENIPVYNFLQKPGDLVWVNVGCIHWVQATGFCNNIAWNVGPFTAKQYQAAIERYEWDKLWKAQSLIPMVHLSWNLARNNNISDVQLYQMIKNCLLLTMRQHYLTLKFMRNKGIKIADNIADNSVSQGRPYCEMCQIELFGILIIYRKNKSYVSNCLKCALKSSLSLEEFTYTEETNIHDRVNIYDNFTLKQ